MECAMAASGSGRVGDRGALGFDEIGYWSEVKLDIIREYAKAYSTILASDERLSHVYIDGFAGGGFHIARKSRGLVAGSPLNALRIAPPFDEYFLVDLDGGKADQLRSLPEVRGRAGVHVFHGDCNRTLLDDVFPRVRYEDYRRGLCVLDPYGLHLSWDVIRRAGEMRSIEIFLNFPIMDMNRNALWRNPDAVDPDGVARMTSFWGDESWRSAAYEAQPTLFGEEERVKLGNREVVQAFRSRLCDVAGFAHVLDPMPMRNSTNAVVYYLFFVSQKPVAAKIVRDIFARHRDRRG
jgi:three-Cys-motif partner protein